jgi:Cu+-exporting ATPase
LASVIAHGSINENELLRLAASLERGSEHPLAAAIIMGANERGLKLSPASDFGALTGKGVIGTVEGKRVAVGNAALLSDLAIDPGSLSNQAAEIRRKGHTVMLVAIGGTAAGLISVADPIKQSAAGVLEALRRDGLRVVMLTGDSQATADAVGRQLGIDEVIAGVLPEQKAGTIRKLKDEGRQVAMAGDGVNDAPALAEATVGIAMGTGADVAMESASVTLLKGDLQGIMRARRLSRAIMRNIRLNLLFAFLFNSLAVPIAAGVLYPFTGLLLNPMIASAAMSASSILVIGNSLRLRRVAL